jgi:hypothetical protein
MKPPAESSMTTKPRTWKRIKSALWFVAILGTVAFAGAEPILGFPVALALIVLHIVVQNAEEAKRDAIASSRGKQTSDPK